MRIPKLFEKKKPVFSLEIFPPKKTTGLETVYKTVEALVELEPDYISVTYGAGGDGGKLTSEIAGKIKREYGIEALAHITCINSTEREVKEMIREMKDNNIENVLALRGDIVEGKEGVGEYHHANELAIEIQRIGGMQIFGACYPEGHPDSPSKEQDIQNLKYKIGAGVQGLITQLFFDNEAFYEYVRTVRRAGIDVPISAGIMPITKKTQVERTVEMSGAKLPDDFKAMIKKYQDDEEGLFSAGTDYAVKQIRDLIEHGVDGVHLYTMNTPEVASAVYEGIKDLLPQRIEKHVSRQEKTREYAAV